MKEITEISFRHSLIKFLILQKIVSSLNIEYRIYIRSLESSSLYFFAWDELYLPLVKAKLNILTVIKVMKTLSEVCIPLLRQRLWATFCSQQNTRGTWKRKLMWRCRNAYYSHPQIAAHCWYYVNCSTDNHSIRFGFIISQVFFNPGKITQQCAMTR